MASAYFQQSQQVLFWTVRVNFFYNGSVFVWDADDCDDDEIDVNNDDNDDDDDDNDDIEVDEEPV